MRRRSRCGAGKYLCSKEHCPQDVPTAAPAVPTSSAPYSPGLERVLRQLIEQSGSGIFWHPSLPLYCQPSHDTDPEPKPLKLLQTQTARRPLYLGAAGAAGGSRRPTPHGSACGYEALERSITCEERFSGRDRSTHGRFSTAHATTTGIAHLIHTRSTESERRDAVSWMQLVVSLRRSLGSHFLSLPCPFGTPCRWRRRG